MVVEPQQSPPGRAPRASPRTRAGATAVAVMDRDDWRARSDNLAVVDGARRRIVWIPRDLFSEVVGDRINEAYARGGAQLLHAALEEAGFAVTASVVLLRSAVEAALDTLRVEVPVERTRRYWYPLAPTSRIEDGAKLVAFEPPRETLAGERIHQWLGARKSADPDPPRLPDLDRIARQRVFVRRLLEDGFDFAQLLANTEKCAVAGERALEPLRAVRADWALRTLARVEPATVDGKQVLVRRRGLLVRALARALR